MNELPIETTPAQITPAIQSLCRKLASEQQPVYVRVFPCDGAKPKQCIPNVQQHIVSNAGDMLLGWCIWEREGINLNAEFHAVWKSPDGEMIDVTPKPDGEAKVLFLADPKLVWEGRRYPNEFVPLLNWREVREYLNAHGRYMNMIQPGINMVEESEYASTMMQLKKAIERLKKRLERQRARRSSLS